MIQLLPGEELAVDAGSNTDLRVYCGYVVNRQLKSYGKKINATRDTVVKGPAIINTLSVNNADSSAQDTQVMVVSNGTDCYLYNESLGAGKTFILWRN